jgi:hypothetical protein
MKIIRQILNWETKIGSLAERAITFGYLAVLFFSILAVYMTCNHIAEWFLFQGDYLWMEDYLQDWLIHGVDMKTWMTPGAPNYFPEMVLYGFFRYVTGSVYWGFIGFGLAKIFLYMIIFYNLISLITTISRNQRLWFSMLCNSVLLLGSILLGSQFEFFRMLDFWQLFMPTAHGGAIFNALIAILLTLLWFRYPDKRYLWLFLLFLLSIVAALSDRLYTLWFAYPALGAIVCLFILGYATWKSVAWLAGVLLIADVFGRQVFFWLVPYQQVPFSFKFEEGWKTASQFYWVLIREGWYHPLVLFSYTSMAIITFYVLVKAWKRTDKTLDSMEQGILFLLPYSTIVLPISFLGMMSINRPETQYFTGGDLLALSFWGFFLIITPFGLRLWNNKWFHVAIITTLIGFVAYLAISPPLPLPKMLSPANPYSPLIACLDSHRNDLGNGMGITDYWQAREIDLFSQTGLDADQAMGEDLRLFQWVSNREMFENRVYTFVMTNTPTNLPPILEEDVIRIQGEPDARFVCDGYPVLVYNEGIQVEIPVAEGIQSLLDGSTDRITIRSQSELRTEVGNWREKVLYSTGKAGWLQFGPYITLPAGSYRVEWKGTVSDGGPEDVGSVDVTYDAGAKVVARTGISRELLSTLPEGHLAMLEFTVDHSISLTEFRFFVNEKVIVQVKEVVITRFR